jgi:hypothetical protein
MIMNGERSGSSQEQQPQHHGERVNWHRAESKKGQNMANTTNRVQNTNCKLSCFCFFPIQVPAVQRYASE